MAYIGKIKNGNTTWPIASTLYGVCNTDADKGSKVVTCADFDTLIPGVMIAVNFINGNSAEDPGMNVNNTGWKSIIGNASFYLDPFNEPGLYIFIYNGEYWYLASSCSARYANAAAWAENAMYDDWGNDFIYSYIAATGSGSSYGPECQNGIFTFYNGEGNVSDSVTVSAHTLDSSDGSYSWTAQAITEAIGNVESLLAGI